MRTDDDTLQNKGNCKGKVIEGEGEGPLTGDMIEGRIPEACKYLKAPHLITGTQARWDELRREATVGEPTSSIDNSSKYEMHPTFQAKMPAYTPPPAMIEWRPTDFYPVTVDGHTVNVVVPERDATNTEPLPSVDDVADSLGALPSAVVGEINNVILNPVGQSRRSVLADRIQPDAHLRSRRRWRSRIHLSGQQLEQPRRARPRDGA